MHELSWSHYSYWLCRRFMFLFHTKLSSKYFLDVESVGEAGILQYQCSTMMMGALIKVIYIGLQKHAASVFCLRQWCVKEVTIEWVSVTVEIAEEWFLQEKDEYSDGKKQHVQNHISVLWHFWRTKFIAGLLGHLEE